MPALLVQICPPGSGGVRDYADALARAWAERGVASRLVEGTPEGLTRQLDAVMRGAPRGDPSCVVLHFSGYGYAPRGLCGWLADDLSRVKFTHATGVRLLVVFHELFATGAPWRSAFWLGPWQAQVARRIAMLADGLWTNAGFHATWLREVVGDLMPLQVRPVFSNVGEPTAPAAWSARAPRAVVFGSAATRQRALTALEPHAASLARLGIREIVEVGHGASSTKATLGIPSCRLGSLPATELGALLGSSRFGILDYPAHLLGKSGVFAAYAANGCAAINTSARTGDFDGLRRGVHYIDLRTQFAPASDASEQAGAQLHRWYGGHSLTLQARELLDMAHVSRARIPALP